MHKTSSAAPRRGVFINALCSLIFRTAIAFSPILIVFVPVQVAAQINCDQDVLTISSTGNPHMNGLSCQIDHDLTIRFDDGVEVNSPASHGLYVSGSGNIKIESETTRSNSFHTTSDANHGILIEVEGAMDVEVGSVSTSGSEAAGIQIDQSNSDGQSSGDIVIKVNDVTTVGRQSNGISVLTLGHTPDPNDPSRTTSNINTNIDVIVEGIVETAGAGSQAIVVEAPDAEISVFVEEGAEVRAKYVDTTLQTPTYAIALVGQEAGNAIIQNRSAFIENRGTVSGDILTEGCAHFDNQGILITSQSIVLGEEGCSDSEDSGLTNSGTVMVGGLGVMGTTQFKGDFHQTDGGTLGIDVNWSDETSDLLIIDGSALLKGSLAVVPSTIPSFTREEFESGSELGRVRFLTATDGITSSLMARTVLLDYATSKVSDTNEETLHLIVSPGTGLDKLNRNQTNVFWNLHESIDASDPIATEFTGLFTITSIGNLRHRLDSYGNEIAGAALRTSLLSAQTIPGRRGDCNPSPQTETDGLDERHMCIWAIPRFGRKTIHGDRNQHGFGGATKGLSSGITLSLDGNINRLGLILDAEATDIKINNIASARGNLYSLGVAAAAKFDWFDLELDVGLGRVTFKTSRAVPVGDLSKQAIGTLKGRTLGVSGTVSRRTSIGSLPTTVFLHVSYAQAKADQYLESGAGDFSLEVDNSNAVSTLMSPGVRFDWPSGTLGIDSIAPSLAVSWTRRTGQEVEVKSKFRGGESSFSSFTSMPRSELAFDMNATVTPDKKHVTGEIGIQGSLRASGGFSGVLARAGIAYRF